MRCPACGHDNLPGADECAHCLESLMKEDVPQPATPLDPTLVDHAIGSMESRAPGCVPLGTALGQALAHMQRRNVGYILVTDDDHRLAGIFTEHDLLAKVIGQPVDLASTPVETLMTANPTAL